MEINTIPKESLEKAKEPENSQIKEEIPNQELNIENKEDQNISNEYELKDHYSLDDVSFSEENSLPLKKKRKMHELSQLILEDNIEEFKRIIEKNKSLLKKKNLEGFSLIQYAALNAALNCFSYLRSLNVDTNESIEGFYLIHLSLMKSIKNKYREKCVKMFKYIYNNLPEQKKYKDRLGRTYLHLILEFNIENAVENIDIEIEDILAEDNMGQFAINYSYIYDSYETFCTLVKTVDYLTIIYKTLRNKFKENKISYLRGEEKFLENLIIYKSTRIITLILKLAGPFIQELYQDLNEITKKYSDLSNENKENKENEVQPVLSTVQYITLLLVNNANLNEPPNLFYHKTAIVYNKDCINHIKLPDNDPIKHFNKRKQLYENSDRLFYLIDDIEGIIPNNDIFTISNIEGNIVNDKFVIVKSSKKSCLNDILKCHDIKYIKALKYKSDNIKISKSKKNGKNEHVQKFWDNMDLEKIEKNYFLFNDNNSTNNSINNDTNDDEEASNEKTNELFYHQKIDIDTYINKYSYENIFNTTGCVFEAIDTIMTGDHIINAFAIIRPPGHHAGYYGPVENKIEASNGYCIVNNVAIAAAYTKYKYNKVIKKIAIVDIDVHHGNGTEEIIQMLNFKNFSKPFTYEKICGVKLEDKRSINWYDFDDPKNVLFISTHIYDKNDPTKFYPYSGSEENNTLKEDEIYPGGIYNIPFEYKKNYSYEYRNILRTKIIPRLYKFKPDFIFISAGFDGHKFESINESNMLLLENDFGYIAEQIQFVANKICNGRVVAVLEGGYNVNTGIISPFVQSIFSFIRHMNIAINIFHDFEGKITSHKRDDLYNEEMEIYKYYNKEELEKEEKEKENENKSRRSERLRHIKLNEEKKNEEKKAMKEIMNEVIDGVIKREFENNNIIKDEPKKEPEINNITENIEDKENIIEEKEKEKDKNIKKIENNEEINEKKEDNVDVKIEEKEKNINENKDEKKENNNMNNNNAIEQEKEIITEKKTEDNNNIEPKENSNINKKE